MRLATLLCVLLVLAIALTSGANIPRTMNYQRILRDADGTLVADGNYEITFGIYDASTGGTALWTDAETLTVEDGVVNVILGETAGIDLPFDEQY
jgi:hypothetical protein